MDDFIPSPRSRPFLAHARVMLTRLVGTDIWEYEVAAEARVQGASMELERLEVLADPSAPERPETDLTPDALTPAELQRVNDALTCAAWEHQAL